jgi:DNA polymerase III delta prime subunit
VREEPLWWKKYRPRTIDDCVLPSGVIKQLQGYRDKRMVPNLILSGRAGVGKTSSIVALLDELECDSFVLNSSLYGNIDTLRTEVTQFASTISFSGGRKYVVLDEADGLTNQTQQGLRNFMEEYASNAGFILTCNYINKLIEPLQSRTGIIEYRVPSSELPALQGRFLKRMKWVLDQEKVPYETPAVAAVIMRHAPDWRRVVNELQRYASGAGRIDAGAMVNATDEAVKRVLDLVKEKKFAEMRAWVAENGDIDPVELFTMVYDRAYDYFDPKGVPMIVVTIKRYMESHAVVANPEINVAAFFTELMVDAQWKA